VRTWYGSDVADGVADALYQPFPMLGRVRGRIWRYAPEYRRPRHFHAEPELNLVTSGSGQFGVGEDVVSVAEGDLLRWLPGQDHVLLDASPDFDLFVIGVSPALSERVLGERDASVQQGPALLRLAPELVDRFRTVCAAPVASEDPAVIERHVGDFWREAHAVRTPRSDMHALTRRVLVSLLERPDLTRSDLTRLARGCPTEVSRQFRRNVGLTLVAYRTRLRLLRFIQGVDDGDDSLLSASLGAGFGSYSQCHRVFRTALGCTPRAFFGAGTRPRRPRNSHRRTSWRCPRSWHCPRSSRCPARRPPEKQAEKQGGCWHPDSP
jgi:AraC-like DNA-binding protein/quercetin dioxygenase-like cupin family protein